jgi:hypothetical protein
MPFLNTLIRAAIKEAKPVIKRGAKGPLEVARETPPVKAELPPPTPKQELVTKQPTDLRPMEEAAPLPKDPQQIKTDEAVVDKQVRESLNPDEPSLGGQTKVDPEIVTRVDAQAAKLKADDLADNLLSKDLDQFDANDSWQPNFDTFETTDDVKATIANMAERNKVSIDEARRGVVTDQQLKLLASEMNVRDEVIKTVLGREGGQALSAETIIATRQFLNRSGSRITEIAKQITEGKADDRAKVAFRRQIELHKEVMEQFMGARAETGRTLRAFGIKIGDDAEQLKQMKEVMESAHGQDLETLASGLAHVDSIEGINKAINNYGKSKLLGVTEELFINSILSGVKTQIVNITGNSLMPIKGMVETSIAARLGRFA